MTTRVYDYLTFIGRFQPFHNGHLKVVKEALKKSHNVMLVIGGANRPRTVRNPWTAQEREEMITAALTEEERKRVYFVHVNDFMYNDDAWLMMVQRTIYQAIFGAKWQAGPYNLGLIGYSKDHSSYYLKMFPKWGSERVEDYKGLHATDVRNLFFAKNLSPFYLDGSVPGRVRQWMIEWKNGHREEYDQLQREHNFLIDYKKGWSKSPYPPFFVTVDTVVVQGGHILLVKRKASPGEGLWALPGGFVQQGETLKNAAIRELYEETKIDVPEPVVRGSIVDQRTYDDPFRSQRGRTITNAFLVKLDRVIDLPKVKGSDDADQAKWIPLSEVTSQNMFEDHYDIIRDLVKL